LAPRRQAVGDAIAFRATVPRIAHSATWLRCGISTRPRDASSQNGRSGLTPDWRGAPQPFESDGGRQELVQVPVCQGDPSGHRHAPLRATDVAALDELVVGGGSSVLIHDIQVKKVFDQASPVFFQG
jgi:hypothetical protein